MSEKKIPQRKAFKKTIIPRMIHRYGKKSGTGEYITGSVNSKSTPRHSGIFNTHMSHLKPQIWQSESHTKQLETQQWQSGAFQNIDARPPTVETARIWRPRPESYTNQFETQLSKPWQLVTNHNTVAKPPTFKKTKTHFSEILKEFNTRLNSIETDVVGLDSSNNKPVSTITSSTEQAIP